jgi:hypothetical protein
MTLTRRAVALLVGSTLTLSLVACKKDEEQYPDLSGYVKKDPGAAQVPSAPSIQPKVSPPASSPPPGHVQAPVSSSTAPGTPTPAATVQSPAVVAQIAPQPAAQPGATGAPEPQAKAKPVKFAKANNIAGEYSRYALGQGKYFESIVAQVEGYRSTPYFDNEGIALGFGFNASHQDRPTNRKAGIEVLKSESAARTLEGLSKRFDIAQLPSIQVNPEQAMGMSLLLKPGFENPMRQWIPGFDQLKPHQQAILVYHSYKTGPVKAMRYRTLKSKIAAMLANPTPESTKAAGAEFQYTFKVKGEVKTDTRSTVYMQSLWNDPEAYAALIGGKASSFVATLPEFKGSGKSSISDNDIDDPIGEVKFEMERAGRRIPMTSTYSPADRQVIRGRAVALGGGG